MRPNSTFTMPTGALVCRLTAFNTVLQRWSDSDGAEDPAER
ncbi:hypothetical protein [Streptomyces spiramyceticus]|nr:hypothetical protein [Streptomyces spiramyceticus]